MERNLLECAALECAGSTALWSAAARRRHSWQSIAALEQELISTQLRQVAVDQSGVEPPHSKSTESKNVDGF
jgi:hypothetical protein